MTHPDSGVLAEFRAGLITGRHGARISAHLASCERCAGVCDGLAGISILLAAGPAPAMPDAVARRLDDVLAAEAAKRGNVERTIGDGAPDRAASPPPRRHRAFRLVTWRVLAPAAVVVLAAGGYGLSLIGSGSTSSVASGSAASSVRAGSAVVRPTAVENRPEAAPEFETPVKFGVVTSGIDYKRATLEQQLELQLQLYARATGSAQELGSLKGCVLRVTAGTSPGTLALVEKAHFQGQPAIVIVAVSGYHYAAWVAASGCSARADHVLATATLPGTSAS